MKPMSITSSFSKQEKMRLRALVVEERPELFDGAFGKPLVRSGAGTPGHFP